MRRYIFILFALFALSVNAQSFISKEQARQTALDFFKKAGIKSTLPERPAKMPSKTSNGSDATLYYVFNTVDRESQVIVSAIHNEVICFTLSGATDTNEMPEEMKWYLNKAAKNGVIKRASKTRSNVNIMLSSAWGQGPSIEDENNKFKFNDLCPVDPTTGQKSYTGCVPTALAQIMRKWQHPVTCKRVNGYTTSTHQIKLDDLESTNFQWGKMKDVYTAEDNNRLMSEECLAVTILMKYIGWATQADYSSKGTGCQGYLGEEAVNRYFDYYGRFLHRDKLSDTEWDDIIYNEISSGRPVYIGGEAEPKSGAEDASGHCFVIDGYLKDYDAYHFNYGWYGNDNLYFYLYASDKHNHDQITLNDYYLEAGCMVGLVPRSKVSAISSLSEIELATENWAYQSRNLNATSTPYALPREAFTYESENPDIATVDFRGKVTAVSNGETYISIYLGKTASGSSSYMRKRVKVTVAPDVENKPFRNLGYVDKLQVWDNWMMRENTWGVTETDLDADGNGVVDEKDGNNIKQEYTKTGTDDVGNDHTYVGAYECVDLGLPSGNKWATKNVGASSPEDAGYYFAWGEAWTKNEYTTDNSLTWGREFDDLKYIGAAEESGGYVRFTNAYDPALQTWGRGWVTPTESDTKELIDYCSWQWVTVNGETGYRITGPNGKSIFLPTSGHKDGSSVASAHVGNYWINQASKSNSNMAHELLIQNSRYLNQVTSRHYGYTVRAVAKEKEPMDDNLYAKRSYGGHNYAIYWTNDPNDIRTNPDGTDFCAATFTIDIDGKIYEIPDKHHIYRKNGDNNTWNGTCAAVDTSNDVFYFYTFSKEDEYNYGMAGYVYEISKHGIQKHEMFTNANFGWHAYFDLDGSSLRWNAFSYAGYYSMVGYKEQDYWSIYLMDFMYPEDFAANRDQNETIFIY